MDKRYSSIYLINLDIIDKLGGDKTKVFDSVYSEVKYIAEDLMGASPKRWVSVYEILLWIRDNYEPSPTTKYTITFNIGDAEGTTPAPIKAEEGKVIILPSADEFEKIGYVFDGWTDGNNLYEAGDEYTINADVTLSAVWVVYVEPSISFPNLYEGYTGEQKYWNIIDDEVEKDIYLDIQPSSARWEIIQLPDFITSDIMSGKGSATVHLTASKATEFRQGYMIVRLKGGSDAMFDIFQYSYPIDMLSNLNNYAYQKTGKIAPKTTAFTLDYSHTHLTDDLFNANGMKGITCRTDGNWKTSPFIFIPSVNNRLEVVNLDVSTIVDGRMSFIQESDSKPWMPKVRSVELRNTDNMTNGLHCTAKSIESINLGSMPDLTTSGAYYKYISFPTKSSKLKDVYVARLPFETPKRNISFTGDNNLTHQSLINIFNALPGGVEDDRQIIIGSTNIAKLTDDEIAIATDKGWVVS